MNLDLTHTPANGHFATIQGLQMYYEVYGEGSPLILLHGYKNSSQQWQPFIADLATHFHVIVPDLRGHGRSLDPSNQFTLARAANDILALLDYLGIDHFQAIGDSAGACMLQYMASQQPSRPEALILIEGGSYFPEQTCAALLAWVQTNDDEADPDRHLHPDGARQIRTLLDQLPETINSYQFEPPDIAAIQAKTLIVFGDRDDLYPVSVPVEMYKAIANAYLWIVPNTGHAFLIHHPDKYVGEFLDKAKAFLHDEW